VRRSNGYISWKAHVGTLCAEGSRMMSAKHFTWIAGLAILALGCQTQVIGGGSGTGGTGGSKDTTTSTGIMTSGGDVGGSNGQGGSTPLPNDGPAIAMLYSQLPGPSGGLGSSGGVTTTGGNAEDPNTLYLFVSNGAQSCVDPYAEAAGCVQRYQVVIRLSPSLQAVGTYSLNEIGYMSVTEPGNPGECSGGGGSYWDGTIDVTAIDATHVTFTLAGTAQIFSSQGNADGTYTAQRCF
jgi:hypothetical protein